jgi:hypothetical protein
MTYTNISFYDLYDDLKLYDDVYYGVNYDVN